MWDPDAGLVVPRSQVVAGILVENAEKTGKLKSFANTPATGLIIEGGRIKGVETPRGTIMADKVIVCAGLWGRLIAGMAGEDLPVMPVDHPLLWFGPYEEFAGTGKDIGWPLLRDQGNSAYMRDTGDPKTTEGGMIEWGYYEQTEPRLCHPRDILDKSEARLSPSQRDLEIEQVMEPLERAMELTPILAELGYDEKRSFNGLLQVTTDGGPSIGESQKVRGLWYAVAIWVKDGPGMAKLLVDWMTDGRTEIDHHAIDYARFYPFQTDEDFIHARCTETAMKIYNPAVHPREPFAGGRDVRRSPFYEREKGARRLFHGARRLGARPRLCQQRAPAGEVRQSGAGARERMGQPPLLARLQRRAPGDERQRRHGQPVPLRHLRRDRPGPRGLHGVPLRRQGRRRQSGRQGHLHPLPRRERAW